jgi:hypothetical protein
MRNYFSKGEEMICSQKEEFKINFIYLVFYLVGYVYKKNQEFEDEIPYAWATIILVNLI